jgi:ubiquinone/menaquinone biosynthesis C-methylase UbiE
MNPAAVLTVKSLAARHKLTNVYTILSDDATSLPDASIDIVLLNDILHEIKKPDEVLAELHRVLKPDGILSVSDHHLKAKDTTARISAGGLFRLSRKGKVFNFSRV